MSVKYGGITVTPAPLKKPASFNRQGLDTSGKKTHYRQRRSRTEARARTSS
ncbi:hypothetical protein [Legionella erythra]|uniref:hypothetical protein n=1 Tax=Legionella erythra TaxID=448 RepID=UPI000A50464C|nr:hypothetical protein [Legionella erythra]